MSGNCGLRTQRAAKAAATGVLLVMATGFAFADEPSTPLRQLLADGYEIKSTDVIPQDIARRMARNDTWTDDLMITLQKGGDIAICHFTLGATLSPKGFLDLGCSVMK